MTTPTASLPTTEGKFTDRQIKLILVGLLTGMLLAALDQTIVSTALKTIAGDFRSFDKIAWVATAYMLTSTASTPLYGKISDIFGRRTIYMVSIVIFLLGSVLAGAAQNMTELIIFRGVQGLGAGGLMPLAFAVIGDIVAPRERSKYQGYFGAVFGLASVAGPLLGGFFTDNLSWRWCFYVNIPVGLVALVLVYRYLHLPSHHAKTAVDFTGAALLVAAVCSMLLGVEFGNTDGWTSPLILGYFVAAVVLTSVFIWWEGRVADPILPLGLFRNPTVANSVAVTFIMGFGMFGAIIYVPQFLQIEKGLSATRAGLQMLPLMLGILMFSIGSGRIISKIGRYKPFPIAGLGLLVLAMYLFSTVSGDTSLWTLSGYMFILGGGLGLVMQTLVLAAQSAVGPRDIGVATSTVTFFRSLGGTIGIAAFGTVLNSRFITSVTPAFDAAKGQVSAALALPGLPSDAKAFLSQLSPQTLQKSLADTSALEGLRQVSMSLYTGVLGSFVDALQRVYLVAIPVMVVGLILTILHKEVPLPEQSAMEIKMKEAAAETAGI